MGKVLIVDIDSVISELQITSYVCLDRRKHILYNLTESASDVVICTTYMRTDMCVHALLKPDVRVHQGRICPDQHNRDIGLLGRHWERPDLQQVGTTRFNRWVLLDSTGRY